MLLAITKVLALLIAMPKPDNKIATGTLLPFCRRSLTVIMEELRIQELLFVTVNAPSLRLRPLMPFPVPDTTQFSMSHVLESRMTTFVPLRKKTFEFGVVLVAGAIELNVEPLTIHLLALVTAMLTVMI